MATFLTWLSTGLLLLFLSTLSLPHQTQIELALGGLAVMAGMLWASRRGALPELPQDLLRTAVLVLGGFLTLRYLSWRLLYTLEFHDLASTAGALALLAAEAYGILMYFLGAVVNVKPRHRTAPPLDRDRLPAVDVLVPSYDESDDILEVTLLAATQLEYPTEKLTVWLLDDGGTEAKRAQEDPEAASEARARHLRLQGLCERVGARYLTRADNRDAKAGNINAALPRIDGELVLMLDADHVPSSDFLDHTVGFFQADPELFLVQTPHRFITPDPVEKNLEMYRKMPGESEIFYRVVQHGLDAWDASFFCGSAALLRRRHLDEIGGLAGDTVTEDAETSMALHARGYRSAYYGRPMVFGLQPETFQSFIGQRCRWAQGMVQIFLRHNPLTRRGLSPRQRMGYLNSTLFWFFSYARLVFLLAPCAYLLLGLKVYDANLEQFLYYAVPHLAGTLVTANLLFGRARWAFISELYESVQSVHSARAVTQTLRNPGAPRFVVTRKGHRLEDAFISPLAGPFYLLFGILIVSLVAGWLRFQMLPGQREVVYITAGWAVLNLLIVVAGLGALVERKQRRKAPRMFLSPRPPCVLETVEGDVHGRLVDISMGGCKLMLEGSWIGALDRNLPAGVRVATPRSPDGVSLPARVVRVNPEDGSVSLAFIAESVEVRREVVALGFGNSMNLRWGVERDHATAGIIKGIAYFTGISLRHGLAHGAFLLGLAGRGLLDAIARIVGPFPAPVEEDKNETRHSMHAGGGHTAPRRGQGPGAGRRGGHDRDRRPGGAQDRVPPGQADDPVRGGGAA